MSLFCLYMPTALHLHGIYKKTVKSMNFLKLNVLYLILYLSPLDQ